MGGGGAKRAANQAAEASRKEAEELRKTRQTLEAEAKRDKTVAQRMMIRQLRARGGMFYEPAGSAGTGVTLG